MTTIRQHLDMVATDAFGGRIPNHYFDESRAPESERREYALAHLPENTRPQSDEAEPLSFLYHLELLEYPDGSLEWIE